MVKWAVDGMIFLGSALMVYNIWGFIRYSRHLKAQENWDKGNGILRIPIVLLILFLMGYIVVGIFGKPDIVMAGILFGGSIFVFVMYRMLDKITQKILEARDHEAELLAEEETNRARIDFLSSMSHEMRTPMNVILGLDAVALRNPSLQPETRDQLEKIGRSGRYLMGLINSILDLNRIGEGGFAVTETDFGMSDMLAQVNAIATTQCEEKGLMYQMILSDEARGMYRSDEIILKQVLLGILDNAVKYTEAPGKVTLRVVCVSSGEKERVLRFSVEDTGIGIDPDFLPRIFDLFTKEDSSATSRFGGSGLGLPAAKSKIALLGGDIAVSSEKNKGSVFIVTVPLKLSERQQVSSEAVGEGELLSGFRILITDDIYENVEIVEDLLELEGAESEHAENGKIALEMFEKSQLYYYDAVLMDLRMPVMGGLEAVRRLRSLERADAKTVPILALSANALTSDIRECMDAGMNGHLEKPVDADVLYATLRKYIIQAHKERGANPQGEDTP